MSKVAKHLDRDLKGFEQFDDPYLDLITSGDDEDKRKKKKKKKKKEKAKRKKYEAMGMSKKDIAAEEAYAESLNVLSKGELWNKLERFGGKPNPDMGRKELKAAIIKLRREAITRDFKTVRLQPSDSTGSMRSAGLVSDAEMDKYFPKMDAPEPSFQRRYDTDLLQYGTVPEEPGVPEPSFQRRHDTELLQQVPPYYFDEETRQFVINKADTAPDMDVYSAMRGLGAIRKSIRKDDGFAEMMDRLHAAITSATYDPDKLDKPIIDVDFKIVDDEPVPAGLLEAPVDQDGAIELTNEEMETLSANIDEALNRLNTTASDGDVREKIEKKKGKK